MNRGEGGVSLSKGQPETYRNISNYFELTKLKEGHPGVSVGQHIRAILNVAKYCDEYCV